MVVGFAFLYALFRNRIQCLILVFTHGGSSGRVCVSLLWMQAFDIPMICSVLFFVCFKRLDRIFFPNLSLMPFVLRRL